jgi:cell wall-associated NlpC family hydrolase
MAGVACPRDADMQERALGERVTGAAPPERGDLVFWRGHVGIVREPGVLLHANAHHMMVTSEPLQDVVTRSAALGSPVTSIRRIAKRA